MLYYEQKICCFNTHSNSIHCMPKRWMIMKIIKDIILYPFNLITWGFKKRNISIMVIYSIAIIYFGSFYLAATRDLGVISNIGDYKVIIGEIESLQERY